MANSRDAILKKLRAQKPTLPDAPPRPERYIPVTVVDDPSPEGLLARFTLEMERLQGEVFAVQGDAGACDKVLELLRSHNATHILAWDFAHIPVEGLETAIRGAGIDITIPETHVENRADVMASIRDAQVGLTGVDAIAATTATIIVSTGPGKGRIPTVLPPVYVAVVEQAQILPRIEDWVARQRADHLEALRQSGNVCFITGPSRTGDIEMIMVLGVHGPGILQVVVKK